MTTPPGWYPDPSRGPGASRWWNGVGWTEHTHHTLPPPPGPARRSARSREASLVRPARIAALVLAIVTPVSLVVSMVALADLTRVFDEVFSGSGEVTSSSFQPNPLVSLTSNLASISVFAAWVIMLVWVHASASAAAELGLPARRTPGWAVGGFLIPVVSLWWPYQSVCDLFPAGDPARPVVRRWWALYLTAYAVQLLAVGLFFVAVPAAVLAVVLAALLQVGAALTLRRVMSRAVAAHAEEPAPLPI